jgi:glyoxylase-like metal-dependent hydrolase (beta-lactamase superfamily II)
MRTTTSTGTSRRALLKGIAGLSLASIVRPGFAAGGITAEPVASGFTLLTGGGGNILVAATEAGKVVVDSGAAAAGDAVRATLGELPGGNVAALFNTHCHLDQIGSNEALGAAGAKIFAHEKTRLRLTTGYYLPEEDRYEKPLPASGRPTESFHTSAATTVGNRRIEYGYLLEAHTDGDIYVAFPDANVIAVGDVVSPLRDPAFDWFGGGWLGGRVDSLAKLLSLGNATTRYVPSYGPVVGRAEVQAEHDVLLKLFEIMVERVRLGESWDDILEARVLDGIGRNFEDPGKLLYDVHKGFWAHHNKLTHDIV